MSETKIFFEDDCKLLFEFRKQKNLVNFFVVVLKGIHFSSDKNRAMFDGSSLLYPGLVYCPDQMLVADGVESALGFVIHNR